MKPIDFVKWLEGFMDAQTSLNEYEAMIADKLSTVDMSDDSPQLPQFPYGVRERGFDNDDGMVPFHEICSCNPKNGGSGICGCVMPNKMVDKTFPSTQI